MVSKPAPGILRLVRPDVLAMLGYEPIEPAHVVAERLGLTVDRIAKLDGNENPYGPSPRVPEALAAYDGYHRYGDPKQTRLRQALAEYAGVGPEHVVAGHGSDELIDLLLRAVVTPGDTVVGCPPTFGMYAFSTRVAGGTTVVAERRDDFTLDLDAVLAASQGDERTPNIDSASQRDVREASMPKAILVASPNNPTGNRLSSDELDALLATGLLVVVDEAYIEFAGGSVAGLVPERENLVVLRTFSKWAGLAGLRAGYGIMPRALADVLMHMKIPYNPNAAAETAMLVSLEDREALMERVAAIVDERERLARELASLERFDVYPSETNFVLARLRDGGDGRELRDALAGRGVFVRHFDTPRLRDCLRISAGTPHETGLLLSALREVL